MRCLLLWFLTWVCVPCLIIPAFAGPEAITHRPVVRLTNGDWRPFLSRDLKDHGFASAVVEAAFDAVGIDVKWGFFPWRRAYRYAEIGRWDGSVVWGRTREREKRFLFSDPVVTEAEYVYSRKDKPVDWIKIEDLYCCTYALTEHAVYPAIEKHIDADHIRVEREAGYASLFPRVISGRSDATIMTEYVADYYLRTHPDWRLKIHQSQTILWQRKYHLIISRKSPNAGAFIRQFNAGLHRIINNGTYTLLLNRLAAGDFDQ